MRILYLFAHYFPEFLGGGEVSNRLMVKALAKRHDVAVVSLADRTPSGKDNVDGVPVEYVRRVAPGYGKTFVMKHRANVRAAYRRALAAVREFGPDLIHASGLDATALAYRIHRATAIPYVLHVRSWAEKCVNPRRLDETKCATCTYWWLPAPARPLLRAYHQEPTREAVRGAARVICVSRFLARMMEPEGARDPVVVYNPVEHDVAPKFNPREKKARVLFAGGVYAAKGVPELLEAYGIFRKAHPAVPLVFVGEGDLKPEGDGVEAWGHLPYERLLTEMRDSRLCVFPSKVPEPFGRVVVEAQSVGTLVVGANTGGMAELLRDAIASPVSPGLLADAMERAWSLHDEEYEAMARRAFDFVKRECDIHRYADRIEAIYRDALRGGGGAGRR